MEEYRTQPISCAQCASEDPLRSLALAMAYVPWQQWNQTYELKKALQAGTIFPELNKPFWGRRGGCR